MLPRARIAVDLFHVVQLAVKTTGDVRRPAIRQLYGRRGKAGDPEHGIKSLLNRNLDSLSPEQFEKVIETLDATGPGQQLAIAWIAKEKLRDALRIRARVTGSTPCERQVRDRLFTYYDWCAQNADIPELQTLAGTISRWENEIVTAVTNATAESLNRLAKLEARHAYGFRNPANQRRRVRIACTRGTRRPSTRTTSTTRRVTRQEHHHG
jgi:transposase